MSKNVKKLQKHFKKPKTKFSKTKIVKIKLIQEGISQQKIADELGVNKSLVSNVIAGRAKSSRVNNWLKENLGI